MRRRRVLHAIHDFLPRHPAGSEIYAHDLATAQTAHSDVWILTAEHDGSANHGALRWRRQGVLPVIEVVNNWEFRTFDETYASARLNDQLRHALQAVAPDVLHVHNLLNLSLDLPRIAHARGIPIVATLHDYTLVCIAGGQRVHRAERHVCERIDPARCARCFGESPFATQLSVGRLAAKARRAPVVKFAAAVRRRLPLTASDAGSHLRTTVTVDEVRRRLAYVRHVFETIDLFVAPSAALAEEYVRLGVPAGRIEVSANGHVEGGRVHDSDARERSASPLRVGYVGSIVWHKGIHVLIDAARGLGGAEVVIHGDPSVDPAYTRALREATAGLPIAFAGGFDRTQMDEVYGRIDILVVPSVWPENAPLVIQEAAVRGIPVVASRIGGLPEFVQDGVNGRLVEPGSADALRRSLASLIANPSERARLGRGHPPVKPIAQDAHDWVRRYDALIRARAGAQSEPVS